MESSNWELMAKDLASITRDYIVRMVTHLTAAPEPVVLSEEVLSVKAVKTKEGQCLEFRTKYQVLPWAQEVKFRAVLEQFGISYAVKVTTPVHVAHKENPISNAWEVTDSVAKDAIKNAAKKHGVALENLQVPKSERAAQYKTIGTVKVGGSSSCFGLAA